MKATDDERREWLLFRQDTWRGDRFTAQALIKEMRKAGLYSKWSGYEQTWWKLERLLMKVSLEGLVAE